jgi:hypothetical protein
MQKTSQHRVFKLLALRSAQNQIDHATTHSLADGVGADVVEAQVVDVVGEKAVPLTHIQQPGSAAKPSLTGHSMPSSVTQLRRFTEPLGTLTDVRWAA